MLCMVRQIQSTIRFKKKEKLIRRTKFFIESTVLDPGKEVKKWNVETEKRIIYLYMCLLLERYVFSIPIKRRMNLVPFFEK